MTTQPHGRGGSGGGTTILGPSRLRDRGEMRVRFAFDRPRSWSLVKVAMEQAVAAALGVLGGEVVSVTWHGGEDG